MPIYFTNRNSLSCTWIYAKKSQNYFQTEKNHQKMFKLNRRKKGDQPHPNVHTISINQYNEINVLII